MLPTVRVSSPSRLHFGLWSLGQTEQRQFGGIGAMLDRPAHELSFYPAKELSVVGGPAARIVEFAERWGGFQRIRPNCRIVVQQQIAEHVGLGSGTQLALAVAAGLNAMFDLPSQSPQELAVSVGRGLRSAVGTYGFVFGGLIVEQGKLPGETISPLDCRIDLPSAWRFVLARPQSLSGVAGDDELAAFAELPPIAPAVTEELIALARDGLVPAAATCDFARFADSLHRYGRLSGECFAARQGGPYNGPALAALVERIRSLGHVGVGQSSWGPTIFAVTQSAQAAAELAAALSRDGGSDKLELTIAAPCNSGACIEVAGAARGEPALSS